MQERASEAERARRKVGRSDLSSCHGADGLRYNLMVMAHGTTMAQGREGNAVLFSVPNVYPNVYPILGTSTHRLVK